MTCDRLCAEISRKALRRIMAGCFWNDPFSVALALNVRLFTNKPLGDYWPYPPYFIPHVCIPGPCSRYCAKPADGIILRPDFFSMEPGAPSWFVGIREHDPRTGLPIFEVRKPRCIGIPHHIDLDQALYGSGETWIEKRTLKDW